MHSSQLARSTDLVPNQVKENFHDDKVQRRVLSRVDVLEIVKDQVKAGREMLAFRRTRELHACLHGRAAQHVLT